MGPPLARCARRRFRRGLAGFEDVHFKTLFNDEASGRYLYLTWFVSFDTSFSPQDTSVYVGLSPAAGGARPGSFEQRSLPIPDTSTGARAAVLVPNPIPVH